MSDNKTSSGGITYRRLPPGTPFRKGQSGNPAGRPKGSKNRPRHERAANLLGALVREEAYRLVKISEEGKEVKMPVARAVVRSLISAAAKGDLRAQATFLKIVCDSEADSASQDKEAFGRAPDEPTEVIFTIVDPVPPKT
ncbi:MAG: DUF5681 domain-containing protein [Pseudomonadota bacterium]